MDLQTSNIESYKKNFPDHEFREESGLKILITSTLQKQPVLVLWAGNQRNPFVRCRYQNVEQRELSLCFHLNIAKEREAFKAQQSLKKKNFQPTLKVGDILASSWGWEQTNVSFYQIVEVPSKCFVVVKEIQQETTRGTGNGMAAYVKGVKDLFLDKAIPAKYKVVQLGSSQGIRINSSERARPWDGKEMYGSWYA